MIDIEIRRELFEEQKYTLQIGMILKNSQGERMEIIDKTQAEMYQDLIFDKRSPIREHIKAIVIPFSLIESKIINPKKTKSRNS
jgi:hypothetical protein